MATFWSFRYDFWSFHSLGSTFKNSSDRSRIWKKRRVDVVTKSCNLFVSGLTNNEIRFGGSSEPSVSIKAMTINNMNRSFCWYSGFIPYWQYQRGSLLYAVLQAKFFFNTVMKQYFKHFLFGREFGGFEIFISPSNHPY